MKSATIEKPIVNGRPGIGRRRLAALAEGLLFVVGYAFYSLLRDLVPRHPVAADAHGLDLLRAEKDTGVAIEASLNHWLAARPTLAHVSTYWYSEAHFVITIALLLTTVRLVDGRRWRLAWYATTALALLVFWLFPTAPPRLLPHAGFIDVISTFPSLGTVSDPSIARLSNQYAAMPSLHVAWALWCAAAAWHLTKARGSDGRTGRPGVRVGVAVIRVLAVTYPLATTWVVLATANHYLSDVLAGAFTAALAFAGTGATARRWLITARAWILHPVWRQSSTDPNA